MSVAIKVVKEASGKTSLHGLASEELTRNSTELIVYKSVRFSVRRSSFPRYIRLRLLVQDKLCLLYIEAISLYLHYAVLRSNEITEVIRSGSLCYGVCTRNIAYVIRK